MVHATGVSARMPGEAPMIPAGMTEADYFADFEANMRRTGADGYYLLHNHPSGNVEPSQADIAITRHLQQALALLEITLVDHIIVAQGRSLSMVQRGVMA